MFAVRAGRRGRRDADVRADAGAPGVAAAVDRRAARAAHGSTRLLGLRHALVIGQVAVSLVLVTLAVTLARNGAAIGAIDHGFFSQHGVMSINVRGDEEEI